MKLFLCLLALTATAATAYRFASSEDSSIEQQWAKKGLSFGLPNHEYRFNYDVQLNTGFAPWIAEQKAVQRMHAQVRVQFLSERSAVLRMEKVRIAKYNDELDSNRIQPMQTMETVEIASEKMEQLVKPVQFTLGDGIVERVHFNKQEPVWSRNIKKAILSLIQLNARKALVFEQKQLNADETARVFTVEEPTMEGICQTTYTLAKISENEMNVTKSVDFEQCRQLADLAYGYQGQQSERQIVEQQQIEQGQEQQQQQQPIPLEKLSRSTIYRQQWRRVESGKHALKSAEVISQYTVRSSKTESGMAMQTVTVGRLQLQDVQEKKIEKIAEKLDSEETIVYNSRFESEEKRFYMYGDELVQSSVFETKQETEQNVAEKVLGFVQKLANEFQKQTQDSKLELVHELEQIVAMLRQLSLKKLESLEGKCNAQEKTHLYDLCTIAGTRNTVALLTKRMPELAQGKIIQILKSLAGNLIAPSESIAELVLKTCQHFDKKAESTLQQSCWLSFSAIVGQVNQQQRDAVYSMEYPTRTEEQKQTEKLAQFAKILKQKFEKASDKYEQVLAIKLIGNAGLKQHLELLEKLIRDPQQSAFIRTEAVDALRRQRFIQADKVQQIVLPVFVDTKQPQELRMACLSMLVSTLPAGSTDAKTIVDQIAYTLLNERSEQVRAFTYSLMKTYAKSPIVAEQQLAKHLQNTLKIVNIEEEELLKRASRHIRIPIYSQIEKEGIFFGMNAAFVPQSSLPTHMSAYIDSMLNGFVDKHAIYVSVCQHNAEQWIQRIFKQMKNSRVMRSQNRHAQEELKKLIQGLKVEQRSMSEEEPFAMATIRVKDIDQVVLPLNEKLIQKIASQSEHIKQILSQLGINGQTLMTLNEKQIRIPTSAGFAIKMHTVVPVIADLSARMHLKNAEASLELRKAHILAAQQQYMKVICPFTHKHTGVQSWRAVELQAPKKTILTARKTEQGLELEVSTPAQETPIVNLRTLPATFVGEQIKSIQNQQLQQHQRDVEYNGQKLSISGFVHKPLDYTQPKELLKVLLTTENIINIVYQPKTDLKKQLRLRAEGAIFLAAEIEEALPEELNKFYAQHKYVSKSSEESAELSRRQQHLSGFMNKYAERVNAAGTGNKAYKHWIKIVAEVDQHKAEFFTQAVCDATFTGCRVKTEIVRPVAQWEQKECSSKQFRFTMNANTLLPEKMYEEEEKKSVHDSFVSTIKAQWGCQDDQSEKKLKLHLAVRPQPAFPRQARVFMNQMELNAEYDLPVHQQHYVQRFYELFKAANFWQSSVQTLKNTETVSRVGTIQARLRIEPINRQYANLTIQTPTERVQIQSLRVPFVKAMPRLSTVGHERRTSIHSAHGLVQRLSETVKSECMLQKNGLVQTFENVHYRAPLSAECFTVLAKDCKNVGEPAFVVLAKKSEEGQQKIVKIITPEQVIIAQPIKSESEQTIEMRLNGDKIEAFQTPMENIEFNGEQLYVRLEGVSVRFDGERIQIRLSPEFTQQQCGLCGELNTEDDWESLRTAQNKRANSLIQFHKSYLVADNECTTESQKKFYKSNEQQFGIVESAEQKNWPAKHQWESYEEENNYSYEQQDEKTEMKKESSEESYDWEQNKVVEPVQKIKIVEYKHKICFSAKPVNMCPRNTHSVVEEQKEMKVQFSCLDRHSVQARRLLREVRETRNQPLKTLADRHNVEILPSFVEVIALPQKCQSVY